MTTQRNLASAAARRRHDGERRFGAEAGEAGYRMLVEAADYGVLLTGARLTIDFVNPQFARLLGYTPGEILGRRATEFMDEAAGHAVGERVARRRPGVGERYELTWRRRDGTPLPTLISARPLFDAHGRYRGSIAIVTDLTERERARVERDELARLVDSAPHAIVGADLDGNVTSWNRGAEKLYGYRAAEILGQAIDILAPPERKSEVAALIARVRAGEEVANYETERVTRSGTRIGVSLALGPIRDLAGALVGVAAIAHDISGARAASNYARSLLEASLDPFVTIGAEGRITDVNEAAVSAIGVPREQLIGSDFAGYFTDPESARAGYREAFAKGSVRDYALALRHRSGAVTDVLYNASVYRDESGAIAGVFAAARDVGALKRAEAELQEYRRRLAGLVSERTAALSASNAKLAAANDELEAFAYSVSHDLQAPLRAIDGFSRILVEDYGDKLDAEGKRIVGVVREGAAKMKRLIEDILEFSRAGRGELRKAPIDMGKSVRAILAQDLAPAVEGRAVEIDIAPLPAAKGDATMIRRVWMNLLDNALKFTAPRPAARIQVGAREGDGETVYWVRDNGVGFDVRYADRLFRVFQRLHGAEFGGTGIGLAIVKRIVTRHGGRVWAEGKLDAGATFYFALPNRGDGDA